MSNYSKIYWLTRLDGINGFFIAIAVAGGLLTLAFLIYNLVEFGMDEYYKGNELENRLSLRKKLRGKIKYTVSALIIGVLVSILLPTQKQAILILAGGKTMDFIEQDTSINKIPGQTTLIISEFLDNQINKLNNPKDTVK